MLMLRELQLDFAAQVYDDEARGMDTRLRANGLTGARRLQVYRNNHLSSLTEALRAVYPVLFRPARARGRVCTAYGDCRGRPDTSTSRTARRPRDAPPRGHRPWSA